jgi:hypothetical protein
MPKLKEILDFDPSNDSVKAKPANAKRVDGLDDEDESDDVPHGLVTPVKSQHASSASPGTSPISRRSQRQEQTLKSDEITSSASTARAMLDEQSTENAFLNSVYHRQNMGPAVLERAMDEINNIPFPASPTLLAPTLDLKTQAILSAIFVETDDRLSIATVFQNLADPKDASKFDFNMRLDDRSSTPLHWASGCGRLALVNYMLQEGASPVTQAYAGETPLMRAVYTTRNYVNRTFPQLLKMLETSLFVSDNHGRNVCHHIAALSQARTKLPASRYYMATIADYISTAYTIQGFFESRDPDTFFKKLIDAQDQFGETPLHIACRYKNHRVIDILLRLDADVDLANKAGETFRKMVDSRDSRLAKIYERHLLVI